MWKKVNKEHLPEGKVLAANFEPRTFGYREMIIGYLALKGDTVLCDSEHEELNGVTHFILIDDLDITKL